MIEIPLSLLECSTEAFEAELKAHRSAIGLQAHPA